MIIIGDVHGKYLKYYNIVRYLDETIQIGDFGFGEAHEWHHQNLNPEQHKVLFGNHDDYKYLLAPHSLGNYGIYKDFFFIRGADSIDKALRTAYKDWWPEEEMGWEDWNNCIKMFEEIKPSVVISHECPSSVKKNVHNILERSLTNRGLEECFERHQPDMWIYGHYHCSTTNVVERTTFICLNELEIYNI